MCTANTLLSLVRYGPVGFGMATNKQEYEEVFISAIRNAFTERELEVGWTILTMLHLA